MDVILSQKGSDGKWSDKSFEIGHAQRILDTKAPPKVFRLNDKKFTLDAKGKITQVKEVLDGE